MYLLVKQGKNSFKLYRQMSKWKKHMAPMSDLSCVALY